MANSNDRLLLSSQDGGSSSEDNAETWLPSRDCSGTSSNATLISNLSFEDGTTNGTAHDEYPETRSSDSHTPPYLIFKRKCLRCRPGLEQDDATQNENPSLDSKRVTASTALFSKESAAFCIPDGIARGYNACVTQEDVEREVRVGLGNYATRWKRGSVLRYTVCTETFESPRWAALVAREAAKATSTWQYIGARFKKVDRHEKATFAIKYRFEPDNCRRDVYARAFFPKTSRGELFVYQLALEPSNLDFLAHILAHELGHILGLSHEFAVQTSVQWGEKNDRSVMNYFDDLSQLQVGQQDREELASYYECDEGQHEGLFITDIEPRIYQFPRINNNRVRRHRSTSKRLYLNYRTKRVRFFRRPSLPQQNDKQIMSSQILFSSIFVPITCGVALLASLSWCAFLLGRI